MMAVVQGDLFAAAVSPSDGIVRCCGEPMEPEARRLAGREVVVLSCYCCRGEVIYLDGPSEEVRRAHA